MNYSENEKRIQLLQIQKMEAELKLINEPFYKRNFWPEFTKIIALLLAITAGITTCTTGVFDAKSSLLELRKETLKKEISEFSTQKDSLVQSSSYLQHNLDSLLQLTKIINGQLNGKEVLIQKINQERIGLKLILNKYIQERENIKKDVWLLNHFIQNKDYLSASEKINKLTIQFNNLSKRVHDDTFDDTFD